MRKKYLKVLKNTAFRFANEEKKLILTVENLDYENLIQLLKNVSLNEYLKFESEMFDQIRYKSFFFGNFTYAEVL